MKVKGVRQHRSIDTFEPVELPALTILIGLNGSGKSHFLEGIENDSIVTDIFASLGREPINGIPKVLVI